MTHRLPFLPRLAPAMAAALALLAAACNSGAGSHATPSKPPTAAPAELLASAPEDGAPSTLSSHPTGAPMVRVSVYDSQGQLQAVDSPRVTKTDAEWRALLTKEQYEVARAKGTERAFCGTLLDNKLEGVYACICCRLPLFASNAKFDSGTGWPSFFQPVAKGNVIEHSDVSHGMVRTEILCARCDGHLGHVFEDGPRPTGLRFCVNSESLFFVEDGKLGTLADTATVAGKDAAAKPEALARAVFAGGCFWCVEAVFEELAGVKEAISGYAGDSKETADYKTVSTGRTKHAEAVEIVYDPSVIGFEDLLKVHFATHDPTTLNRQGADEGPQYRSAIFYMDDAQKQVAQAFLEDLTEAKAFSRPIVTTLEALPPGGFYAAETYHQNYVCENPMQGYVRGVALPKVEKVREKFKHMLKETSPLEAER